MASLPEPLAPLLQSRVEGRPGVTRHRKDADADAAHIELGLLRATLSSRGGAGAAGPQRGHQALSGEHRSNESDMDGHCRMTVSSRAAANRLCALADKPPLRPLTLRIDPWSRCSKGRVRACAL